MTRSWPCFPRITTSRRPARYRGIWFAQPFALHATAGQWSYSAFRQRVPRRASATSSARTKVAATERTPVTPCANSRKSRRSRWRGDTSRPAATIGTQECFSGASRRFWQICGNILPKTHAALETWRQRSAHRAMPRALAQIYPQLENISVDYAILEPATRQAAQPRLLSCPRKSAGATSAPGQPSTNCSRTRKQIIAGRKCRQHRGRQLYALDAQGNFLWSPKKFIAAIGVRDLVVVETPDALLICPRDRAQDVGKIVKWLETQKRKSLL